MSSDLISRKELEERLKGIIYNLDFKQTWPFELIKNAPAVDAVELPCKIGDTVWCIRNFHGHKHAQRGIVSEMYFTKEMKLLIRVKYVGCGQWGEKIFPTCEDAEAALRKEEENEAD